MSHPQTEGNARRRAGLTLIGTVIAVTMLIAMLVAVLIAPSAISVSSTPTIVAPAPTAAPRNEDWAAAAENELAARPMLQLPAQAALPQTMTTQTAGPAITLPQPTQSAWRWIPGGFPPSPRVR
jgi:hypothetical protein